MVAGRGSKAPRPEGGNRALPTRRAIATEATVAVAVVSCQVQSLPTGRGRKFHIPTRWCGWPKLYPEPESRTPETCRTTLEKFFHVEARHCAACRCDVVNVGTAPPALSSWRPSAAGRVKAAHGDAAARGGDLHPVPAHAIEHQRRVARREVS